MTKRFPILHSIAEISGDLAFFGLFVFFMLRPYIQTFSFLPLGAALLFLRLFDTLLLRKPRTAGFYIAANLLPGLLVSGLSLLLLTLEPFHPAAFAGGALTLLLLTARVIYQAASVRRTLSPGLTADLLFLQCLAVSLWRQFSPLPGLQALWAVTLFALLCTVADLAASRLTPAGKADRPVLPLLLGGLLAVLLALLAAGAASFGQAAAGGIAAVFLSLFSAVKAFFRLLGSLIASLWAMFAGLLPEGSGADTAASYEPYSVSPEELAALEEKAANARPEQLLFLLAFFLAAAALIVLCQLWKKRAWSRTVSLQPVRTERRGLRSRPSFFRSLVRAAGRLFSDLSCLLFRSGHISALLIRAHWYGRRKLCPRKRGETVREYLLRLEARDKEKGGAHSSPAFRLLARCADQYLYGPQPPQLTRDEIRAIKKAFPLL